MSIIITMKRLIPEQNDMELNKIICGDSYKLIKNIPNKSIDLIITDPPYEIGTNCTGGGMAAKKGINNMFKELKNNSLEVGIREEIFEEFMRVMRRPNIYIWCNKILIPKLIKFFVLTKGCCFDIISWHKTNAMPLCGGKYLSDTEYCLYFHKDIKLKTTYETAKTHYEIPINITDKEFYFHPTIKPLNIIKNFILNSSEEGEIIADFFTGSGTTCVAAKELNRQYIGIEISEKWAKIAENRLSGIDARGQIGMFLR